MAGAEPIRIEVVLALPERQAIVALDVPPATTLGAALQRAQQTTVFADTDLTGFTAGIFGRIADVNMPLTAGDRIELYRPLIADPKAARRRRAARAPRR